MGKRPSHASKKSMESISSYIQQKDLDFNPGCNSRATAARASNLFGVAMVPKTYVRAQPQYSYESHNPLISPTSSTVSAVSTISRRKQSSVKEDLRVLSALTQRLKDSQVNCVANVKQRHSKRSTSRASGPKR